MQRVGQPITATVVEPVYAYDRIVIPKGAQVVGRIAAMPQPSKASRARAMLSGDFSPHRALQIEFDAVMRNGVAVPMRTIAANETPHAARQVARAADVVSAAKEPGRVARLKEWAVERLPYHPQVLRKGTEYDARLLASLHSIDVSGDDHVVIDEEGGAAVTNSKSRFVAPALAMLAMRASLEQGKAAASRRARRTRARGRRPRPPAADTTPAARSAARSDSG